MALVVHKYGGTSLSTAGRIRDVAARLAQLQEAGHGLIVVVSAMGDSTNQLRALAHEICADPDPRELDMLLTTGERVSMALLSMALRAAGVDSISLTGSQSGIITDDRHTRARILDVRGDRILAALDARRAIIVAGFQGVSAAREITTLGRGGSDVTAIALATRFAADRCEIYTDVDGVYTANPGRVAGARRLARIDHASMATYARLGAGVLHPRAARRAAAAAVPLRIVSSFIPGPGTEVGGNTDELPEVLGIGCIRHAACLELPGTQPAALAEQLDAAHCPYLTLLRREPAGGTTVLVDERNAGEVAPLCAEHLGTTPERPTTGTLVSVVTRPDIALGDRLAELLPDSLRLQPVIFHERGAAMALVDPAAADRLVLDLHRQLVETAIPTSTRA